MSSGEEFEVDEILEQRKRQGVLEYLVRWQGFNDLYDSWEPAAGLTHCKDAIKAFLAKNKRSRSKSRSRSRGRQTSKSRSKSRSTSRGRGRPPKSPATPKTPRSRSRSASRKTPQSAAVTKSSSKTTTEVKVAKKEASPTKTERGRSRTQVKEAEAKASTSKTELVSQRSSLRREGGVAERKTEVVQRSVETIKSTPVRTSSETMATRSRLAVRQVQNDQKAAGKSLTSSEGKETWVWWFADHAVLILFIIISIIALSFTIESVSGVRDKLVPDFTVLRQRLVESYDHSVEALSHGFNSFVELLPTWGEGPASSTAAPPKAATKSTGA